MTQDPRRRLLAALAAADRETLPILLEDLSFERTLDLFDGRVLRNDDRRSLVQLLCFERVQDVPPLQLAALVHAMRSLRNLELFSSAIATVFTSLHGEKFRDFKYGLNATGDSHDLEHVVFQRMLPHDRKVVLDHIYTEAIDGVVPELRVLSDIDDTVIAMIHDRRYKRGTVVPGAVAFLTELDHGASAVPNRPGDLTFVTARPSGPRGLIEQYTRNGLSKLDLPPHAVLGGSFFNVFTKRSIAARKMQNFDHERQLFPECRLVFVGDSGQADPMVGKAMLDRDPHFVARIFIHLVTPLTVSERTEWEDVGITPFETYAGAARDAAARGLISHEGADRVCAAVFEGIGGDGVHDDARQTLLAAAEREARRV